MSYTGDELTLADVFGGGIPFEGKIDLAYFSNQPNADTARKALAFLSDQNNELELLKRHDASEVAQLWKATFRACLAHGVPIPDRFRGYAGRLGIVIATPR